MNIFQEIRTHQGLTKLIRLWREFKRQRFNKNKKIAFTCRNFSISLENIYIFDGDPTLSGVTILF